MLDEVDSIAACYSDWSDMAVPETELQPSFKVGESGRKTRLCLDEELKGLGLDLLIGMINN